jgi:hypothetical protein
VEKFNWQDIRKERNVLSHIRLYRICMIDTDLDRFLIVKIHGKMKDTWYKEEAIESESSRPFVEYWTFIKRNQKLLLIDIDVGYEKRTVRFMKFLTVL